jgi:hypothetical protein
MGLEISQIVGYMGCLLELEPIYIQHYSSCMLTFSSGHKRKNQPKIMSNIKEPRVSLFSLTLLYPNLCNMISTREKNCIDDVIPFLRLPSFFEP